MESHEGLASRCCTSRNGEAVREGTCPGRRSVCRKQWGLQGSLRNWSRRKPCKEAYGAMRTWTSILNPTMSKLSMTKSIRAHLAVASRTSRSPSHHPGESRRGGTRRQSASKNNRSHALWCRDTRRRVFAGQYRRSAEAAHTQQADAAHRSRDSAPSHVHQPQERAVITPIG